MARVIASAGSLLRHARAHEALGAERLEFLIEFDRPGCGVLKSSTGRTELPIESRWFGKGAMLSVSKLVAALKSIENQPITLDLHEGLPCKLFAYQIERPVGQPEKYETIVFDL